MKRAAVVVIRNEQILLMKRCKDGKRYYHIPGGRMEQGETPEQTAVREIKEETCLDIEIDYMLMEYDGFYDHEYLFVAKNIQGEACLGGPELERNCPANHYEIAWIKLKDLKEINLLPEIAKQKILETFAT